MDVKHSFLPETKNSYTTIRSGERGYRTLTVSDLALSLQKEINETHMCRELPDTSGG